MKILGTRVDNLSREQIIEKIKQFLSENKFHQIATVNQEFLLAAGKDEEFRNVLNNCDLNVADSMGLNWPFWLRLQKLKCRFPGADLMQEILKTANDRKLKIFLACSGEGLSSYVEVKNAIHENYPGLYINGEDISRNTTTYNLQPTTCDIVFCNFGHPYQEKFLSSLKKQEGAKIKLAMGVGGSFDFLTGKIKRAPKIMQKIGLEWLWRLLLEPRYRFKRVFRALVIFPIRVFLR